MFRSAKMKLYNLIISREGARSILSELGKFGYLHFEDNNKNSMAGKRLFHNNIIKIN